MYDRLPATKHHLSPTNAKQTHYKSTLKSHTQVIKTRH